LELLLIYNYCVTAVLVLFIINFVINNIVFKSTVDYSLPDFFRVNPPLVSILIPARNEENNIKRCLRSLIKQEYPNTEIIVLDDSSSDNTYQVVKEFAQRNSRVRLISGKPLKKGWLGKCYACHQLSRKARGKYLVFTDADTLHFPNSISSALGCLLSNKLDALSAIPGQIMVTLSERLVVTWVHFGILSLLPLILIRKSKNPLFCTANGQFMLFKSSIYRKIGGHRSVKAKVLEDIHISKQVKRAGYRFMVFDGSRNIYCRMHRNTRDLIKGFSKFMFAAFDFNIFNTGIVILLISSLFLYPFILLPIGIFIFDWPRAVIELTIIQVLIILAMRAILAIRLKNRLLDIFFHPLSMFFIILICMNSVMQARSGRAICWKGRSYDVYDPENIELTSDEFANNFNHKSSEI
jgi:chlorobactene glucosyltransferase